MILILIKAVMKVQCLQHIIALALPEILIGRGPKLEKILWRYFGDVIVMTSLK